MKMIAETIRFELPESLACPQPTELRKLPRDGVRLLVTTESGEMEHTLFSALDAYLERGDVLVVNTSATRAAAFPVGLPGNRRGMAHFSTRINTHEWLVEVREVRGDKTIRWREGTEGMTFALPGGGQLTLKDRFYQNRELLHLWVADLGVNEDPVEYMATHALPIQYEKLSNRHPLEFFQTLFSMVPGSSEMPSAGRGFTPELVDRLVKKGVVLAPVLLHTGVSSLEEDEKPYPEYMEVSPQTADAINQARRKGGRIIAVGTTSVRAIESTVNAAGEVVPFKGLTELYIDNGFEMQVIEGLLTGFHEPRASHLKMLQALAGFDHIERAYRAALAEEYYWHQFGDLHLILP